MPGGSVPRNLAMKRIELFKNRMEAIPILLQILRIMQEALWNIRKHSHAKTVRIMLRHHQDGGYYILIEDDGVGFSKQVYGSPGEHVGLAIMRERALRFGGDLRIESDPGEGTRVVLVFSQPESEGHSA